MERREVGILIVDSPPMYASFDQTAVREVEAAASKELADERSRHEKDLERAKQSVEELNEKARRSPSLIAPG